LHECIILKLFDHLLNSLAVLIIVWIFSGGVSAGMAHPAFRINLGVDPNSANKAFVFKATVC
jgi:hypothetical protein